MIKFKIEWMKGHYFLVPTIYWTKKWEFSILFLSINLHVDLTKFGDWFKPKAKKILNKVQIKLKEECTKIYSKIDINNNVQMVIIGLCIGLSFVVMLTRC